MSNVALIILGCVFVTQLVNWIGKSVLQDLTFALYSRIFLSGSISQQVNLRRQIISDKAQLNRTSSQDEFSKWAKLRRKVDKGLSDLEILNKSITSTRSSFNIKFSSLLWISTTGIQIFIIWYHRFQPIFWLPNGWIPYPIEWILSFPSAPIGSVSSGAWCAICRRVLLSLAEISKNLIIPISVSKPVLTNSYVSEQKETVELEHEKLD
ncbi:hypothetical protein TREMEDRAFT_44803 [Tremella mesenterica DSM 1558]|uniref:uncharacterized protein n=1 Tax=Tremella mesenterica (strain ATCC 24925 / CBS 8224 / DSM 1558 / NBRC 9311 / NRRL Y-6157 / RJB 2259-6 / UBC 559-6) TaxID=578456 RepID=UPI0003F49E57|nr:uncharacterized protein TREMEDRAFT_44803 [Tremella mesenterica DSM 1558]EIW68469.1 hypothetical protein TREMEDRAFT_44803 [Tremella mesenterica DSM 1558]